MERTDTVGLVGGGCNMMLTVRSEVLLLPNDSYFSMPLLLQMWFVMDVHDPVAWFLGCIPVAQLTDISGCEYG